VNRHHELAFDRVRRELARGRRLAVFDDARFALDVIEVRDVLADENAVNDQRVRNSRTCQRRNSLVESWSTPLASVTFTLRYFGSAGGFVTDTAARIGAFSFATYAWYSSSVHLAIEPPHRIQLRPHLRRPRCLPGVAAAPAAHGDTERVVVHGVAGGLI
jgi:hypothetical protein